MIVIVIVMVCVCVCNGGGDVGCGMWYGNAARRSQFKE